MALRHGVAAALAASTLLATGLSAQDTTEVDLTDPLALLPDPRFPIALCAWETQIPDSLPVVTIDYEHAGFLAGLAVHCRRGATSAAQ